MANPGRALLPLLILLLSGCTAPSEEAVDVPEGEARLLLMQAAANATRFAYEIVADGEGPLLNATGFHDAPNGTRYVHLTDPVGVYVPEEETGYYFQDLRILTTPRGTVYVDARGGWSVAATTNTLRADQTALGRYLFDASLLQELVSPTLQVTEARAIRHDGRDAVTMSLVNPSADGVLRLVVAREPPRILQLVSEGAGGAPLVRFDYDDPTRYRPSVETERGFGYATAPQAAATPEQPYQGVRFLLSAGIRPGEVRLEVRNASLTSLDFHEADTLGTMYLSDGAATIAGRSFRFLDLDEDGLVSRGDAIAIETHHDAKPGVSFVLRDMPTGVMYPNPDLAQVLR